MQFNLAPPPQKKRKLKFTFPRDSLLTKIINGTDNSGEREIPYNMRHVTSLPGNPVCALSFRGLYTRIWHARVNTAKSIGVPYRDRIY